MATTNPVELTVGIVRHHARNVNHWRNGDMRLRWAAVGMGQSAGQHQRVKGYRQLRQLAVALLAATASDEADAATEAVPA